MTTWTSSLLSLLRGVAGLMFFMHGTQKLFGLPTPMPGNAAGLPPLILAAGWLELAGGSLLVIGLLTRPVAFVLAGEMAVAYFKTHAPNGLWPILNGGELAALYCFLFLYFAAAGGGRFSADTLLRPRVVRPLDLRPRKAA